MESKFYMVVSLVAICLISAFALAQIYAVTKIKIEQQKVAAVQGALTTVLPSAVRFEEKVSGRGWFGYNENGARVGIAFQVNPRGYGGPIGILVGIDTTNKITGLRIASPAEGLKETPGLGLKVREPWFTNQFINKKKDEIKLKRDGGTIDAITAATISSRAVVNGIREGLELYEKYLITDTINFSGEKTNE